MSSKRLGFIVEMVEEVDHKTDGVGIITGTVTILVVRSNSFEVDSLCVTLLKAIRFY